jgi:signal peptidase I
VKIDAAQIQTGDIIAFRAPDLDLRVCQRVIEVVQTSQGRGFITQGDGNSGPDRWIVYPQDVEGKIVAKVSYLLPVFSFIKSLPGMIVIETIICGLMAIILVPRIRLELRCRRARPTGQMPTA